MEKNFWSSIHNIINSKISLLLFIALFITGTGRSQDTTGFNYTPPLEIPVKITSNFGDTRLSSFHFGIDFGTNEQEGQPVYSVADGYISRIKIEPGGYGRAVYIDHPNGTNSVYAHLRSIKNDLAQFVKIEQYKKESFYVDLILKPEQFKIKQKELIGYSGNAGLSSGPHLHFELRDTKSQDPINCFLNCYSNLDTFKPVISKIWIYNENHLIQPEDKKSFNVDENNGTFKIKDNEIIHFPSDAGIGVEAFDYITNNTRKLSFYSLKLYIDDLLWFSIINDRIPFDQMPYVNSFVDYKEKVTENRNIVKQFLWPNQELMLYKTIRNQGMIKFNDTLIHNIKIIVADKSGNASSLSFQGKKSNTFLISDNTSPIDKSKIISWSKKTVIDSSYIKITFPENSLYSDIMFSLENENAKDDLPKYQKVLFSPGYKICSEEIPLKKPFIVAFPLTAIPEKVYSKVFIAQIDKKNKVSYLGGKIENRYIATTSKLFGKFALLIDTVPPQITPLNLKQSKNMNKENYIRFKINDELSGISEYRGTIDSKWVLFEYDAKNNLLSHTFDSAKINYRNTPHNLVLSITDNKGNNRIFKSRFIK